MFMYDCSTAADKLTVSDGKDVTVNDNDCHGRPPEPYDDRISNCTGCVEEHEGGACTITVGIIVASASNNSVVIVWGGDDAAAKEVYDIDESVALMNRKAMGFNTVIMSPGTRTE